MPQITISLERAKQLYQNEETKDLALQAFTEEELIKTSTIKTWGELGVLSGYAIGVNGQAIFESINANPELHKNIFKKEKQALSALAMAQLSQLMYVANEGWEADWEERGTKKYLILRQENNLVTDWCGFVYNFLAFKSKEIRDEFLEKNKELIQQYFMI